MVTTATVALPDHLSWWCSVSAWWRFQGNAQSESATIWGAGRSGRDCPLVDATKRWTNAWKWAEICPPVGRYTIEWPQNACIWTWAEYSDDPHRFSLLRGWNPKNLSNNWKTPNSNQKLKDSAKKNGWRADSALRLPGRAGVCTSTVYYWLIAVDQHHYYLVITLRYIA